MAKAEDDLLKEAIINTDREIFGDAFGKEELTLDETGDRSIESMGDGLEGQHEPEEGDEEEVEQTEPAATEEGEQTAKPEGEVETETKPVAETTQQEPQGRVPAGRLREEAEARRKVEAERDAIKAQLDAEKAASQKAVADLNAKFEALLALQRQQPPAKPTDPQPVKPVTPDLFEDPNAFAEHINKSVSERFDAFLKAQRDREVNASIEAARTHHGQAFEDAFGALKGLDFKNPDNVALVKRMEGSPNPGEAIVTWHRRNQVMQEVGDDPAAYRARIAEETRKSLMADPEFRKELLASLRSEAMTGDQGRPRTTTRLPPSLNRAPGSNTRAPNDLILDGSDSATFASAWSTP